MTSTQTVSRLTTILCLIIGIALTACHNVPATSAQSSSVASPQPQTAVAQPPSTILIIRHAEKPQDDDTDLSPAGNVRAQLLVKTFLPDNGSSSLPTPQYIFAAAASHHSNRSALTVEPLANALHLPVNDDFKDHNYAELAADLLSGKYAGKTVLISWHHGKIPDLTTALGATPPYNPWPTDQFDRIWRIDYANGKATLSDLPYTDAKADSK